MSGQRVWLRRVIRGLLWCGALLLILWTLRRVPIRESWEILQRLGPRQILTLVAANGLVLLSLSGRWWFLLDRLGYRLPYLWVSIYRLAGFGVSYYTPGPQFGGEPLQAYLVHRRHNVAMPTVIASLTLDRTLELVVNFSFLAVGTAVLLRQDLIAPELAHRAMLVAWGLLVLPVAYLAAIWRGWHPLSAGMNTLVKAWLGNARRHSLTPPPRPWLTTIGESEQKLTRLCRDRKSALLLALLISIASWVCLMAEFWLALHLLGLPVTFPQAVTILVATRLAILLPFPGGLGALEASQVWMLTALSFPAAGGLSFAIVNRVRDLILATTGLGAGWSLSRR